MKYVLCLLIPLACEATSSKTLYSSLDPQSIPQHLALYELFPDTQEGQRAAQEAFYLLGQKEGRIPSTPIHEVILALGGSLALTPGNTPPFSKDLLSLVEQLGASLPNRKLKGFFVKDEKSVLSLEDHEIDIGKALLLTDSSVDDTSRRTYEALLDLMALQIKARLPTQATPPDKIQAINQFLFHDMKFRFPAHSSYSDDIDLYTFLPSVINSRKGVCLGVSLLYLSIAQRLDLPLEIITPPGHIYIRYDRDHNIETTARGIHLPCERYLDLELLSLKTRTKKEAIGLVYMNQAAHFWKKGEHEEALACYDKALTFLPNEPLIQEFRAYHLLFLGREDEGYALLEEIKGISSFDSLAKNTIPEDILNHKIDLEGLKLTLSDVKEDRAVLLERKDQLSSMLKSFPEFRAGHFALALTWLNLKRAQEAILSLLDYHNLDATDPSVEYMLASLYLERFDSKSAWMHFHLLKDLLKQKKSSQMAYPKAIEELERRLMSVYHA